MPEDDDNKRSVFNAGVAQAERIDALQRAINAARFNPLAMNPETSTFNYEVMLASLDGLLKEAWGKMKEDDERPNAKKLKELVHNIAQFQPPVKRIMSNGSSELAINIDNYRKLMKLMEIYENEIRDLLEIHELNSPNKDWDDDDDL